MVYKVTIEDNKKTPIKYLADLKAFKNDTEYTFNSGVNIIVGENGCGKTTLMKLIEAYLIVDKEECDKGILNSNINQLFMALGRNFLGGVSVIADYEKNTFRLCHVAEKGSDDALKNFNAFGTYFTQKHASTGEGVNIALQSLFHMMFNSGTKLTYDYNQFKKYPEYIKYISKHKKSDVDEWTVLMDEPDRNLDIENINQIKNILSFHKPQTQIIAVIHNPLLIYSLSKNKEVNFIEMTEGYIQKIKTTIDNLLK